MDDLVKLALSPATLSAMTQSLRGLGSGAGMGGLVGGAGGALLGGYRGYEQQRDQGAGTLRSALGGLSGALGGAGAGALLGAGAGGLAGAAGPGLAARLAKSSPTLQRASNFGQRQAHTFTGLGDAKYVRSIGGGASDARKRLNSAEGAWKAVAGTPEAGGARRELLSARNAFGAARESEQRGLNSIPGYLKSLGKDPMGTLRAGAREQWTSSSPAMRAAMYGLPAVATARELATDEDVTGEGRGRFERAGNTFGYGASGLAMPLPIAGDIVAGGALAKTFGRLGRAVDRRVGHRPPSSFISNPDPVHAGSPADPVLSDRAAGAIPESLS